MGGEKIDKGKETGTDEEMDGTSKVVQEILADLKTAKNTLYIPCTIFVWKNISQKEI